MAESINTQISDKLTERHLQALRVETALRQQVWESLRILEQDILSLVKAADPTQYALLLRRRHEIERLMGEEVESLIILRYERLARELDNAMARLANNEAEALQTLVNETTQEETIAIVPPARQLRAGIVASIFPSVATAQEMATTASDWWSRQATSLTQRLHDQMLVSVSLEENLVQLSQRITGTVENGRADGIMARAREDARRLLTTQTTNAVGEARVATAARNAQRVVLQHSALIEERNVCMICFVRHGKRFQAAPPHEPIGHDIPYLSGVPYHPLCRCSFVTVVAAGGVITDETLAAWLRRQGTAYQDAVLGPTRAQLFRAGKLTPKDLLAASTGRPLTVEELGA